MEQLSGLDAIFLDLETPNAPMQVGSLVLLEARDPPIGYDDIRRTVEERLHLLPPFRRRLAEVPLGIDHPYWFDDPDFDIEYHVRRLAVLPPGSPTQLAEMVARMHARRLDRSRPMWEMNVIEGLPDGDLALYTKLHHAAVDGVSGAEMLTILLDLVPDPPPPQPGPPPSDERAPSSVEMFARGAAGLAARPWRALGLARQTLGSLPFLGRYAEMALPGRGGPRHLSTPRLQAPATPFNSAISPRRTFAFGSLPLADVKAVKDAFGVTVNDVVMAMCAGALRRYLEASGDLPDEPLQAMVPISVRTEDERGAMGNRVTSLVALLRTDLDDPVERLHAAHDAMATAKEHDAVPADLLMDFSQFSMPAITARAARLVARAHWADRFRTPFNVVISNVPGPQIPLYLAGARLRAVYPVSAIVDGIGLNITLQSYSGSLDFGLVADRAIAPDVDVMIGYLAEELAALCAAG